MVKVSLPTGQPWFNCQWSQDSMVKVSLPTGQPSCLTVCPTVESRQNGQSDFPTGQPQFYCQWNQDSMVKMSYSTGQPQFNLQ